MRSLVGLLEVVVYLRSAEVLNFQSVHFGSKGTGYTQTGSLCMGDYLKRFAAIENSSVRISY